MTTTTTSIVVGVDGSEGGAQALRWARRQAALHGATLTAVLAWNLLDHPRADLTAEVDLGYGDDDALAALDAFVERALGREGAAEVERRVVCDHPAQALLSVAADADLLVVGARGLGGFTGMLLGSVSQHCLHHAPCPVAVVRPGHEEASDRERVVVGVDGSGTARVALRWALEEGRRRAATVTVVHAWRMPFVGGSPWVVSVGDSEEWEKEAAAVLERALAEEDTSDVVVEPQLVHGAPAVAVVEAARHADLVVVGSRGVGGFKGLVLGSVGLQVTRHAGCPVVVVPPGEGGSG